MPQRQSSFARSITACALMLMVGACSTAQPQMPTADLPANLLVQPPTLPLIPKAADGQIDGRKCLVGALDLYDVAGGIRVQLLGLIAAEKAGQAATKETK